MENFKVCLKIIQDPHELDYLGYTSDKTIYKYLHKARINYWDIIGEISSYNKANVGPVVAAHQFEILFGIESKDELSIYSRISEIGKSSLTFLYEIYDSKNNICVRAKEVLVGFDFDSRTTIDVNDELKARIKDIENGNLRLCST